MIIYYMLGFAILGTISIAIITPIAGWFLLKLFNADDADYASSLAAGGIFFCAFIILFSVYQTLNLLLNMW